MRTLVYNKRSHLTRALNFSWRRRVHEASVHLLPGSVSRLLRRVVGGQRRRHRLLLPQGWLQQCRAKQVKSLLHIRVIFAITVSANEVPTKFSFCNCSSHLVHLGVLIPRLILNLLKQMANNGWLYIKTLLNVIQHGTSIGPGSRVGGSNSHTSPAQPLCASLFIRHCYFLETYFYVKC